MLVYKTGNCTKNLTLWRVIGPNCRAGLAGSFAVLSCRARKPAVATIRTLFKVNPKLKALVRSPTPRSPVEASAVTPYSRRIP